jgi:hypothetical protein
MIRIDATDNDAIDHSDPKREVLFEVGGQRYTIPKKCKAYHAVGYATVARRAGADIALSWAMEALLGSQGLTALVNSNPSDHDMQRCIDVILGRVQGLTVAVPEDVGDALAADEAPKARAAKAS